MLQVEQFVVRFGAAAQGVQNVANLSWICIFVVQSLRVIEVQSQNEPSLASNISSQRGVEISSHQRFSMELALCARLKLG